MPSSSPPPLATRLLKAFLLPELIEEVTGDLEEAFQTNCKRRSVFSARLNYWYQVINYVRPFALRRARPNYISSSNAWLPLPMANALPDYPEIIKSGHYVSAAVDGRSEIRRADKKDNFFEEEIVCANQGLLNILETPFISANAARALSDPHTVVITRRKATKYFPGVGALGKLPVLNNDEQNSFKITGVINDFPDNTHFHSDFLLSSEGHESWPGEVDNWGSSNYFDYVLIRPGTDIKDLEVLCHHFRGRHCDCAGDDKLSVT